MTQLLPPPLLCNFTPPSSPTKVSSTMNWLKRTPTSVPLPPSPTKSRDSSDNESISSTESVTLIESNFRKGLNPLQKKSSTFPLQHKVSSSSLSTTPVGTPQREASRWLFRPSPVHATTFAPPANELSDHFVRSLQAYKEKQTQLCPRLDARRERARRMRAYLGINANRVHSSIILEANDPFTAIEETRDSGRHHRYDSGSHEHGDSETFQELQKLHYSNTSEPSQDAPPTIPLLEEDFLYHVMMRIRNRNLHLFDCVGCNETNRNSHHQGASVIWLLHGCRHLVHAACFGKFRDIEAHGFPNNTGNCYDCESLKRMMKGHTREEMDMRHNRLLEATSTGD